MKNSRAIAAGHRNSYTNRGIYESQYCNADEAEWVAALNGIAHISQGTRDDMMSDSALECCESSKDGDSYMIKEEADENLQAAVLEIIQERMLLLGTEGYPFELKSNSLVFKGEVNDPYLALLTLCKLPSLTKSPYNVAPQAFEYLSLIAAKTYLGKSANGWRFGWPRHNAAHIRIADAAKELQKRAGNDSDAWHWRPVPSKPTNPSPRDLKDAGMDFVAWLPWHDLGPGQLHLVGQCACGQDWQWKKNDLDFAALSEWMLIPTPPPVRALFTPRHLALPTLRDAAAQAGLVFDRIRIVQSIMSDKQSLRCAKRFARGISSLGKLRA